MRFCGNSRPLDRRAARTRSRLSRHEVSGRPTIVKPGRPFDTWTSTRTGRPSTPEMVADATVASTVTPFGRLRPAHAGRPSGTGWMKGQPSRLRCGTDSSNAHRQRRRGAVVAGSGGGHRDVGHRREAGVERVDVVRTDPG